MQAELHRRESARAVQPGLEPCGGQAGRRVWSDGQKRGASFIGETPFLVFRVCEAAVPCGRGNV